MSKLNTGGCCVLLMDISPQAGCFQIYILSVHTVIKLFLTFSYLVNVSAVQNTTKQNITNRVVFAKTPLFCCILSEPADVLTAGNSCILGAHIPHAVPVLSSINGKMIWTRSRTGAAAGRLHPSLFCPQTSHISLWFAAFK